MKINNLFFFVIKYLISSLKLIVVIDIKGTTGCNFFHETTTIRLYAAVRWVDLDFSLHRVDDFACKV